MAVVDVNDARLEYAEVGRGEPRRAPPQGRPAAVTVRHRIPNFTLLLQRGDEDVTVPVNAQLHDLHDRASHDLRVDCRFPSEPPLEGEYGAWAAGLLQEAGLR
jgi:hypothetical protein